MKREIFRWWSPSLQKEMPLVAYGHYGFALLLFPTAAADFLEYERFFMIDALRQFIESGTMKVYSINSINNESWLNPNIPPPEKSRKHYLYNLYVENEVVPFIFSHCNGRVPIITSGASFGALHGANYLFRRPDLFEGTIAMSGIYDLKVYTNGYYDSNCYFNSPIDYLPNLNDTTILNLLRQKKHIHLYTAQGPYERPQATFELSEILHHKGIPHTVDLWDKNWPHDWPTWRAMLPSAIRKYFL